MTEKKSEHIRPGIRYPKAREESKTNQKKRHNSNQDIDVLLSETQGILDSWLNVGGTAESDNNALENSKRPTGKDSSSSREKGITIKESNNTIRRNKSKKKVICNDTSKISVEEIKKDEILSNNDKDIIFKRKSSDKISKDASNKNVTIETLSREKIKKGKLGGMKDADVVNHKPKGILRKPKYQVLNQPNNKKDDDNENPKRVVTSPSKVSAFSSAAVKEKVVERNPTIRSRRENLSQKKSNQNHQSVEGYTPRTGENKTISFSTEKSNKKEEGKEGEGEGKSNEVIETQLEFSVLSAQEYIAQQQEEKQEKFLDENEQQKIFQGHAEVFPDDDDDDDESAEDDDPSFEFDFWNDGSDEHIIDTIPPPEPRAFMKLWSALSELVTPEACQMVKGWQQNDGNYDETQISSPPMDNDVAASRCAGLMALLNMHLQRSLADDLKQSQKKLDQRFVKQRLAELLRTFNYSRPTAKLNTKLWRAMTCVLVNIVNNIATDVSEVPPSASAVGINMDEFKYLTKSYFSSFSHPEL